MAGDAGSIRFERLQYAEIVRPEAVHGMGKIGAQERESITRREGMRREGGIREDADEGEFGERARCPAFADVSGEPFLDLGVGVMGGPSSSDQDIYVQQESRVHSRPASSSLTFSELTGGESGGRSATWKPLTTWVCRGA